MMQHQTILMQQRLLQAQMRPQLQLQQMQMELAQQNLMQARTQLTPSTLPTAHSRWSILTVRVLPFSRPVRTWEDACVGSCLTAAAHAHGCTPALQATQQRLAQQAQMAAAEATRKRKTVHDPPTHRAWRCDTLQV